MIAKQWLVCYQVSVESSLLHEAAQGGQLLRGRQVSRGRAQRAAWLEATGAAHLSKGAWNIGHPESLAR
jgi:hypothetical protein